MTNTGVAPFSIVLLFENQANSLQVAPSLRDKGLEVDVVTTASELIKIIASQKIDLVGLSVNHSSASSLVQVLKVRTNVSVLVFGEDQSMATTKAVLKTAGDFQVSGAVSSYNIWMKIGHLVKEKQRAQVKKMSPNSHNGRDEESPLMVTSSPRSKLNALQNDERSISVVKSNKKSSDDEDEESTRVSVKKQTPQIGTGKKKMVMKKPLSKQTKDNFEKSDAEAIATDESSTSTEELMSDDFQNQKNASAEDINDGGKILKVGMRSKQKERSFSLEEDSFSSHDPQLTEEEIIDQEIGEIEQLFFEDQEKKSKSPQASVELDASGNGSVVMVSKKDNKPSFKASADDGEDALNDFSSLEAALLAEQALHEKSIDLETPDAPRFTQKEESAAGFPPVHNPGSEDDVSAQASVGADDYNEDESSYETEADKIVSIEAARIKRKQRREKKAAEQKQQDNSSDQEENTTEFRKLFQQAVEKAGESKFSKLQNQKSIGVVTKISIIPVANNNEKGFILVANNENQFSSAEQMRGFKQSLSEEMKNLADMELDLGEVFNIETQSVDVFAWAEESSQFFSMYEDNDTQMIICFLRKDTLLPQIQKVDQYEMHKIEVYALPAKTPLEFDAYLYLERNDKMFPYLRRGGHLTHQQIDRLYNNGFKFLYIKDIAIRDYYAFYLSQYFNQDFQSVKKLA